MAYARRFSDEHMVAAVRLLALRLWRSPMAKDWRDIARSLLDDARDNDDLHDDDEDEEDD